MINKLLTVLIIAVVFSITPVIAFQQGKTLTDITPTINREQIRNRYQFNLSDSQIKLVEVKKDNGENVNAYLVELNKEGKLFNLFRKRYTVREYINAETGNDIATKYPWYYRFMRSTE